MPRPKAPPRPHVTLRCKRCSVEFTVPYSTAMMGKAGRQFCGNACYLADKDKKPTLECAHCGKTVARGKNPTNQGYNYRQRFCTKACGDASRRKGGYVHRGYRIVTVNGKDVFEHRHVVEQAIGRPLLADETVHHISPRPGTKLDNRYPENLEIWSGRHGKGHRAKDHVAFAIETLKLYPWLMAEAGYRLLALESAEATEILGKPSFADFDAAEVIRRFASLNA